MRFFVIKDIRKHASMRYLLTFLLSLMMLSLVSHLLLYGWKYGWNPESVLATIMGNEELFIEPLPFEEILLQVHTNLFFIVIVLSIIAASFIRLYEKRNKYIHLLFITALFSQMFFLAIPLWGLGGVFAWAICEVFWHLVAFYMAAKTVWGLNFS
ncbi:MULTISPECIES: hypothetical protein [unclassified Nitratiruptor]|uniref:hypothetical protein n=1 Tax=unclassified Nitratiruptor TaxID=2624044 RepID=UPI00191518FF|nr:MULTISPECIES: hypothetical protein [unclassified Nitratiruptor]BCD59804.1 hypothetical protein NitYY0810_C0561 [Nitratiruptor sp. YY08-10]BCD63728.1 hypothetical protein NitYY0814_C0561 [Nitratiruptor sp. YY08-14]